MSEKLVRGGGRKISGRLLVMGAESVIHGDSELYIGTKVNYTATAPAAGRLPDTIR